nr:hypothetical protein [Tanacetum cinerariifolium]
NESEVHVSPSSSDKPTKHDEKAKREAKGKIPIDLSTEVRDLSDEFKEFSINSTNRVTAASAPVTVVGPNSTSSTNSFNGAGLSDNDVNIVYSDDEEDGGTEADFSNLETSITVNHILTTKVHKDHPVTQIIGDLSSAPQTRSMARMVKEQGNGTTWLFDINTLTQSMNYQPVVVGNQPNHTADMPALEDITYSEDEEDVGAEASKIIVELKLCRRSLFNSRCKRFSSFLYKTIKEEVYVCQPPGFEDPDYPDKVYKVVKALYGLHQAPRAWYETLANYLLENDFQRGNIDKTLFIKKQKGELTFFLGLQVKQKQDGIFISQDKYVAKILRKFGLTDGKSASTPIDTEKPLLKDPDIKKIFRYLKGKPHLGLWYPKDSPFNLVAYSDSDYTGESLDRKSTTGGCQFLGCRLISWQWKKQTVVATSSTKAKYVAAAIINVVRSKLMLFGLTIDAAHLMLLEIFAELARIGYEKPLTNLTFYKAFFLAQWKFLIHKILQCMSAKRAACNEFSSSMASAVICLATGGKFNFLKYIFDSLVRNVDSPSKFYMYPRFLQLIINAQIADLSSHTTKYTSPTLTQKVFANMRRVGKGFSGVDTPLFASMLVPQQAQDVEDAAKDEDDVNENML